LESPQAVVALVAAYRFPFKEVHLPSRDARARVGRLAVHWTWGHFTSSEFEPGWSVCRDTEAQGRGFDRQAWISCPGGTDQGRRSCAACRARSWISNEVHGSEWGRSPASRSIDKQVSAFVLICGVEVW